MKKLITLVLLFLVAISALGQRAKIEVEYVSPDMLKLNPAFTPDSTVATGLNVVAAKTWVYVRVWNFGSTHPITSATWTILSKPTGSGATIVPVSGMTNWAKFKVDSTGTYNIKVSMVANNITKDTTMNVYASKYVGVGNFDGVPATYPQCMTCHSPSPTFQNIFNKWKVSGHGTTFKQMIDSGPSSFATYCMKCHTTGYDHNIFAVNNGFDDVARNLGWNWSSWAPPKTGNWDSLKNKYPSLVNFATVGCESCHGPGSEHALTVDKNKIAIDVNVGTCAKCHDSPWRYHDVAEWNNGPHKGIIWSNSFAQGPTSPEYMTNSFNNCIRCHDGRGYVNFTYARGTNTSGMTSANLTDIACSACHDPHGNSNEHYLRSRPVNSDTLANGYHYGLGNGKVCMDCHKSRRNAATFSITTVSSANWGPHHSTQGDVLLGLNYAPLGFAISGSHKNITGGCVGCHMTPTTDTGTVTRDKVGGHSMRLHDSTSNYYHVSACTSCHPGKTKWDDFVAPQDFDGDGNIEPWQKEISGMLYNMRVALPPVGLDSINWQLIKADSLNNNLKKAYYNYLYISGDGSLGLHNPFFTAQLLMNSLNAIVGITQNSEEIPIVYALSQNYPNPFNPSTKINFDLPKAGFVTINVYDISGRLVKQLANQQMSPGKYTVTFDSHELNLSSGVYFYRINAGNEFVMTKKMILVK